MFLKLLIFIFLIKQCRSALCPPQDTIACICNSTTKEISCRGSDIDLEQVFNQLNEFLPENERDFNTFYMNIIGLKSLNANIFKGIRFNTLFLGGTQLTHINRNAFIGTEANVKEFYAFGTNLSIGSYPDYYLFDSINSLRNLQRLVITGSNIAHIPDRAFKSKGGIFQKNLSEIELGLGIFSSIESIGTESFSDLPSLKSLSFSGQRINHIKFHAFSSDEISNETLIIDLTANQLNDTSFEIGSLLGAKRPMKIHFGLNGCNPKMIFLNESIFKPFFDENPNNQIDIGRNCRHMICDCKLSWVLDGNYDQRIKNLKCDNGLSLRETKNTLDSSLWKCYQSPNNRNVNISLSEVDEEDEHIVKNVIYDYSEPEINEVSDTCKTTQCWETAAEIAKYMNKSVNPCEDFYDYACGNWEDIHLLDYLIQILSNGGSEYDNFVKVRNQIDKNLDFVLSLNNDPKDLEIISKSIEMYKTCKENENLDLDKLNDIIKQIGGWPIVPHLHIDDEYHWENALAFIFSNIRSDILISIESQNNIDSIKQLKISHSSFILSETKLMDMSSKSSIRYIASYAKYIHDVAVLLGANPSNISNNDTLDYAMEIIKFESELAEISDRSSGKEFLIERDIRSLKCLIPEIDWLDIFSKILNTYGLSLDNLNKSQIIFDMHYMIRVSILLSKTDPTIIANYLGWRVVETLGFLTAGKEFLEHQQTFHSVQSNEKTKELWKQCLTPLKSNLPYLLTRKYAEIYLTESQRQTVKQMVSSVKQSFISLIDEKDWLEDKKNDFIIKAQTIQDNIGYPDWIFNDQIFSGYHQVLSSEMTNTETLTDFFINLRKYSTKKLILSIGLKVNKTFDWDPSPLYVGASYDIINNIITLPIGLLHPPFYDPRRPTYLNYASIGSFIGHEISHSSMPRYSMDEELLEPWDDNTLKAFLSKAKCFVDQYSSYFDFMSFMNLDGMKTFEEDIGDIAGLKASFNAYKIYLNDNQNKLINDIKPLPLSPQFSPQQLFFISYAQKWCRYITGSQVRIKILNGVHSPEKYRVNGALSNFENFAQAFDCPIGSAMNPDPKCELW